MIHDQMNNNKLELIGTVIEEPVFSHDVFGEGFYETKLSVPRLSQQTDIIPITISERLIEQYNVKVGEKIHVVGQFRSYNKIDGDKSKLLLTGFVRYVEPLEDEGNPNNLQIIGYICKPPVYRTTPFNREICDILLAVNRAYNKSDYIPCIVWGRNARYAKDLPVGEKLLVVGRVQSRVYTKAINEEVSAERVAYEVSVSKMISGKKLDDPEFDIAAFAKLL